jgi:excisionase family DNA binding protein
MSTPAQNLEEQVRRMSPVSAPPEEREEVVAVFRLLDRASHPPASRCRIVGPDGQQILIPESMFYVFERVAEVLARGDAITVLPVGQELTTQQAADILNVSRQYLVRLLDQGTIPFTRTGTHRRIRVGDLLAYKQRRDLERAETLDSLTAMSQDMGGYDEIP